MALEFSIWPPGSVEKYRSYGAMIAQRDGTFGVIQRAELSDLARRSELAEFTDTEIAYFVDTVLADQPFVIDRVSGAALGTHLGQPRSRGAEQLSTRPVTGKPTGVASEAETESWLVELRGDRDAAATTVFPAQGPLAGAEKPAAEKFAVAGDQPGDEADGLLDPIEAVRVALRLAINPELGNSQGGGSGLL